MSRRVRYRLGPAGDRTRLTVEDEIGFLGLARLASPLAARDLQGRRRRSLERLRELAERGLTPTLAADAGRELDAARQAAADRLPSRRPPEGWLVEPRRVFSRVG